MEVTSFDKFRINSSADVSCVFIDVKKIGNNSSEGFMTVAYEIPSMQKDKYAKHKVEVRIKERQISLITYKYSDSEIPEWWRDAKVLYSWEQD